MSDIEEDFQEDFEIPNAADEVSIKKARQRKLKGQEKSASLWRSLLSDETGRAELWSYLSSLGTFEDSFACGPNGFPQPEATWFRAGKKSAGQQLFLSLQIVSFELVHQMLVEHDPRFPKPGRKQNANPYELE